MGDAPVVRGNEASQCDVAEATEQRLELSRCVRLRARALHVFGNDGRDGAPRTPTAEGVAEPEPQRDP